jgi:hypothetical protein
MTVDSFLLINFIDIIRIENMDINTTMEIRMDTARTDTDSDKDLQVYENFYWDDDLIVGTEGDWIEEVRTFMYV